MHIVPCQHIIFLKASFVNLSTFINWIVHVYDRKCVKVIPTVMTVHEYYYCLCLYHKIFVHLTMLFTI